VLDVFAAGTDPPRGLFADWEWLKADCLTEPAWSLRRRALVTAAVQRARWRSTSLEACGPHRITAAAKGNGARC